METDRPYSLGDVAERKRRISLLHSSEHITPVLPLLEKIKNEKNESVPFPDPLDGGIKASLLFLLERPGPQAKGSGFISRNNPDPTAKNTFNFLEEAKIPRKETFLWNIIPWYGPVGSKFINSSDILEGVDYAKHLIGLMPNLKGIVFVGNKAKKGLRIFDDYYHQGKLINTFFMFHTSNQSAFGGLDPKENEIRKALREISDFLKVNS